jgi:hypothetical protein
MTVHAPEHTTCPPDAACAIDRRALALWPGLDRRALARCRHDAACIARLVGRRSGSAPHTIRAMLLVSAVTPEDGAIWFG